MAKKKKLMGRVEDFSRGQAPDGVRVKNFNRGETPAGVGIKNLGGGRGQTF